MPKFYYDVIPTLIIFAGANGSGKSRAAKYLLPRIVVKEFINADEIARGLSPLNPEGQKISAGKIVRRRIDELLDKENSFAIETTLAGGWLRSVIQKARARGFKIEMHYIYSDDVRINL